MFFDSPGDEDSSPFTGVLTPGLLQRCSSWPPQTEIMKLWSILNAAAWVTTCTKKFDHITPILRELHWLPINQCILFNVLVLTFKALHNLAPAYVQSLLTMYTPARTLQSSSTFSSVIPKVCTKTYGEQAFSYAAPATYNKLPPEITQSTSLGIFKPKLKTYLFELAYPQ